MPEGLDPWVLDVTYKEKAMKSLALFIIVTLIGCGGSAFTTADPLVTGATDVSEASIDSAIGQPTEEAAADTDSGEGGGGSSSSGAGGSSSGPSSSSSSSSGGPSSDSGGNCTPGATECLSDTQVETCTTSGQWGVATTCVNACVSGGCGGSCAPGATQCSSDTQVQTCDNTGTWQAATTCADACVGGDDGGLNGNCGGSCVPSATRCLISQSEGNGYVGNLETCESNGTWGSYFVGGCVCNANLMTSSGVACAL